MRIVAVTGENVVDIDSYTGIAGSIPFQFSQVNADGSEGDPVDISGITPRVEILDGTPEDPGTVELTLAEGSGITRDNATGTFTIALTMAQTSALEVGEYLWRFLFFEVAECTDMPFYGRWTHRRGRT